MTLPDPIVCPSCYRRNGGTTIIEAFPVTYLLPNDGGNGSLWVYQCTDVECKYSTTEHELLYHAFRVHYHKILAVLLHIRGWCAPSMNTEGGKLWVISRAIETYFEKNQ